MNLHAREARFLGPPCRSSEIGDEVFDLDGAERPWDFKSRKIQRHFTWRCRTSAIINGAWRPQAAMEQLEHRKRSRLAADLACVGTPGAPAGLGARRCR